MGVDLSNQRKVQTPMFSNNNDSKKDKYFKPPTGSNVNKGTNLIETNNKIKDKKSYEDNILNNILNADNYRFKSNMLNSEVMKNDIGKASINFS